jgi:hypothetical protein
MEKSEEGATGAVTVTVIARLTVRFPETPVTENRYAPGVAELATVSVSLLAAVVAEGVNDAVTPDGKPVALNATVPLNPPCGTTLIVALPLPPCTTVTFELDAERV